MGMDLVAMLCTQVGATLEVSGGCGTTCIVQLPNAITVSLSHTLDKSMYDLPLTLKTYLPDNWTKVIVTQGKITQHPTAQHDDKGAYILYQITPNTIPASIHT